MRCVVAPIEVDEMGREAEFLGLMFLPNPQNDLMAIVRYPHSGLYVEPVHPSRIRLFDSSVSPA
jgi:hypothetical protein